MHTWLRRSGTAVRLALVAAGDLVAAHVVDEEHGVQRVAGAARREHDRVGLGGRAELPRLVHALCSVVVLALGEGGVVGDVARHFALALDGGQVGGLQQPPRTVPGREQCPLRPQAPLLADAAIVVVLPPGKFHLVNGLGPVPHFLDAHRPSGGKDVTLLGEVQRLIRKGRGVGGVSPCSACLQPREILQWGKEAEEEPGRP